MTGQKNRVLALAFDPDGMLVSVGWPRLLPLNQPTPKTLEVRVWNPDNGQDVRGFEVTLPTISGTLAANGRRLAVSRSGSLMLVDIPGGPMLTTVDIAPAPFTLLTLSPDGRMAAWCPDSKSVQVCDTSASARATFAATEVSCLAFSPDGSRLAVARRERDTGVVEIWDNRTGGIASALRGPVDRFLSVAFSSDGRRLAAGGADKSVIVWDLDAGKELFTFRGHLAPISTVAFNPDGTRLASGGSDGTVRIWDVRPAADGADWR
jgi:WD40 repeat protein